MKRIILAIVLLASPSLASDDKPSVCVSFEELSSKAGPVAVCHDGKAPKLYTEYSIVQTKRGTVLLGWR